MMHHWTDERDSHRDNSEFSPNFPLNDESRRSRGRFHDFDGPSAAIPGTDDLRPRHPSRAFAPGFDGPHAHNPFAPASDDLRPRHPSRDFAPGFDGPHHRGPSDGGRGGHGFPPHGGHGGPGMPGGLPPRRPDPDFLKRRVEEGDLLELIDMAGRMVHRRPQGGPARGQALILSILAGREALSQRELQRMLGIQPGSLSELLSKLEGKGLLTREKAEDRRGNLLRITDAGRQAIPQEDDDSEDDPFAPLSSEQRDALADALRALLNAWIEEL